MESSPVTLRELQGERGEMADLQRVFEAAPQYAQLVTGAAPGQADAQSTYSILPEGKSYDDKLVLGVYLADQMIGCVDLIRGYPDPSTAYLALLLIAEPFQRRGFGRAAYEQVEAAILSCHSCNRVLLAVVRTNDQVIPFWRKLGFSPTGETRPYRYGSVVSEHVFLVKPLDVSGLQRTQ